MTTFQIECTDKETGANYTALIDASREDIAKIKAVNEGHTVNGLEHLKNPPTHARTKEENSDGGLMVVAFLIPIIGLLVGIIRLGTKNGGGELVAIAIGGMIFWFMVVALIAS